MVWYGKVIEYDENVWRYCLTRARSMEFFSFVRCLHKKPLPYNIGNQYTEYSSICLTNRRLVDAINCSTEQVANSLSVTCSVTVGKKKLRNSDRAQRSVYIMRGFDDARTRTRVA